MRRNLRWLVLLLGMFTVTTMGCGSFTGIDDGDVKPYNTPPTVIVRNPAEAQVVEQGDTVKFRAAVADTEDFPSELRVEWSSSIDGVIYSTIDTASDTCPDVNGDCTFYLDSLSVGEHVITVRVLDLNGFSGAESVSLTVTEASVAPSCQILSPSQGTIYSEGESVTFTGLVDDANGKLVGVQSIWASDLDGTLTTMYPDPNGNLGYTAENLSVGQHTITLLVQDETDLTSFCSLYITVDPANSAPIVQITSPSDSFAQVEGEALRLEGIVSDDNDKPEALWLTFESNLNGVIFEGRSDDGGNVAFTTSELLVGDHTIRLTATDSGSLKAEDSVLVTINAENTPPTVAITGIEPEGDILVGTSVSIHAQVGDAEDGPLPLDLVWTSSLQGVLEGGGTPGSDGMVSLVTSALVPGLHNLTLVVRDTEGLPASASSQVLIRDENEQPTAIISGPVSGSYLLGETLLFEGVASDVEDEPADLLVIWTSDRHPDPLESSPPDDAGNISFLYSGLSVGNHLITLSVIDTEGKLATATSLLSIRPPNQAPTIEFTGPEQRTYALGDTVIFSAAIADTEDSAEELVVAFESDRNGRLCESAIPTSDGNILCSAAALVEGTHLVTARVTDRDQSSAVDDIVINIEVENRAPEIAGIEAPADYSEFVVGTPVVFRAQVEDAEDPEGSLLVRWTSNLDGEFNTDAPADGGSLAFTYEGLQVGEHTITLEVEDSEGAYDQASVFVYVVGENTSPSAEILQPDTLISVEYGESLSFVGLVSDLEDEGSALSIRWTSDIDGELSSNPAAAETGLTQFSSASLTPGVHTISLRVQDTGKPGDGLGLVAVDEVTVTVLEANSGPDVSIVSPENAYVSSVGTTLTFEASATDDRTAAGDLLVNWSSDIDGELFDGNVGVGGQSTFTFDGLSVGIHLITVLVTDESAASSTDAITLTITAPNTAPVIESLEVSESIAFEGTFLTFTTLVSDAEDLPQDLILDWTSSIDLSLGQSQSDADGNAELVSNSLSVGSHLITLTVTDTDGRVSSDNLQVTVRAENEPPSAAIVLPGNGDIFFAGETIIFEGLVEDDVDDADQLTVLWSSSLVEAPLSEAQADSRGVTTFSTAELADDMQLAVGTHTIYLDATDTDGQTSRAQITLEVRPENARPDVEITAPTAAGFEEGQLVEFEATVSDLEDASDSLTYRWLSDLLDGTTLASGVVASDGAVAFSTSALPVGVHRISLEVTDLDGGVGRDELTIAVSADNEPPTVEISEPLTGGVYSVSETVLIEGEATDPDGVAGDMSYALTSNVDAGDLATGNPASNGAISISLAMADLSAGTHTLTLTVTDVAFAQAQDSISITMIVPNQSPSITITEPESGSFSDDDVLNFAADVSDPEDAPELLDVRWESDKDGVIFADNADGSGESAFSSSDLTVGTHVITATVTDVDGATADDTVTIIIGTNTPPDVQITAPEGGTVVAQGDTVLFEGLVSDLESLESNLTVTWSSNLIADNGGVLFSGNPDGSGYTSFALPILGVGTHEITLTAVDELGLDASTKIVLVVEEGNAPPGEAEAAISPTFPRTGDDLLVSIVTGSVDPDGDAVTYKYQWYKAETLGDPSDLQDGFTASLIPYLYTAKAEVWTVRVTPTDGVFDGPYSETSVTIFNTAPIASSVLITPTTADENTELAVDYDFDDADAGDVSSSEVRWYVNSGLIDAATGSTTLDGNYFNRGDVVLAQVTPHDGEDSGTPQSSNSVTIINSEPSGPNVQIAPSAPNIDDPLTCTVSTPSIDPDGDTVTYTYEWYVDGRLAVAPRVKTGNSDTLSAGETAFGEEWTCRVIPDDGSLDGPEDSDVVDVLPDAGDLVITELMIRPGAVSENLGEYIEIYNPNSYTIPLDGFNLEDNSVDSHVISSAGTLVVPGGGRRVLGVESSTSLNGGIPVDYEYNNFTLTNNGDTVTLSFDGITVDSVSFSTGQVAEGRSLTLDPAQSTASANDVSGNWCLATSTLAGAGDDIGSPGSVNEDCDCSDSDGDGDGFGDVAACAALDCNDSLDDIHPFAIDSCGDGIDADCEGGDRTCDCEETDLDGDGFGTAASCENQDCDDDDILISPAASELCDEVDNDCDSDIDEGFDDDADGNLICVLDGVPADCDDSDPSRSFLESESCDAIDNDCDASIDENFDNDGDGNPLNVSGLCVDEDGAVITEDCDDNDADQYVGNTEICDNTDNDCDGLTNEGLGDFYETVAGNPNNNTEGAAIQFQDVENSAISIIATIHSPEDVADYYYIDVEDDAPISDSFSPFEVSVTLTQPSGANYHLYLEGPTGVVRQDVSTDTIKVVVQEATSSNDSGTYYIVVEPEDADEFSCGQSYRLEISNEG